MKNLKIFTAGFLMASVMFISIFAYAEPSNSTIDVIFNKINITVNGKPVSVNNILYNGTTYAPMRAVAEMLGKEVEWVESTSTANIKDISNNSSAISEKDGYKIYLFDGIEYVNSFDIRNKFSPNCSFIYNSKSGSLELYNKTFIAVWEFDILKPLIERVPYKKVNDNYYIEYKYYSTNILPLLKK